MIKINDFEIILRNYIHDSVISLNLSKEVLINFENLHWSILVDECKSFANPFIIEHLFDLRNLSFDLELYPKNYVDILKSHHFDKNYKIGGNPPIWSDSLVHELNESGFELDSMKRVVEQFDPRIRYVELPEFENIWYYVFTSFEIDPKLAHILVKVTYSFRFIFSKILYKPIYQRYLKKVDSDQRKSEFSIKIVKVFDNDSDKIIRRYIHTCSTPMQIPTDELNKIDTLWWMLFGDDFKQRTNPFTMKVLMNQLNLPFNLDNFPNDYIKILRKYNANEIQGPRVGTTNVWDNPLLDELLSKNYDLHSERNMIESASPNIKLVHDTEFGDDRFYIVSSMEIDENLALLLAKVTYQIYNSISEKILYAANSGQRFQEFFKQNY